MNIKLKFLQLFVKNDKYIYNNLFEKLIKLNADSIYYCYFFEKLAYKLNCSVSYKLHVKLFQCFVYPLKSSDLARNRSVLGFTFTYRIYKPCKTKFVINLYQIHYRPRFEYEP